MKTVLVLSVLLLLAFAVPGVDAADPCDGHGPEGCAGEVVETLTGCNPNYQYLQPCQPRLPVP